MAYRDVFGNSGGVHHGEYLLPFFVARAFVLVALSAMGQNDESVAGRKQAGAVGHKVLYVIFDVYE